MLLRVTKSLLEHHFLLSSLYFNLKASLRVYWRCSYEFCDLLSARDAIPFRRKKILEHSTIHVV